MRRSNSKKKFIIMLFVLLIVGLGIGYAILTQQLSINNTVSYSSMKWDVGFITASNGEGSVYSNPTISQDKKSITVSCNIGTSTESETCIVNAAIRNASTFGVELESNPIITYDDTYINSVTVIWTENDESMLIGDFLGSNVEKEIQIVIVTNELTKDMLPSSTLTIPVTIAMNWVESETYEIGEVVSIGNEMFNIIIDNGGTVSMLAKYNLGTNYRQSTSNNYVSFSDSYGWEYEIGPKEIDIQTFAGNAKTYVNSYVSYLKNEIGDSKISGNLITLKELKLLGCSIKDDYTYISGLTCANSMHKSWLVNNQSWWTRSVNSPYSNDVWMMRADASLHSDNNDYKYGIRPVITISKYILKNLR